MAHLSIPFALLQYTKPQRATISDFIQSSLCPAPSFVHGPLLWTTNSHNPMLKTLAPFSQFHHPVPSASLLSPSLDLKSTIPDVISLPAAHGCSVSVALCLVLPVERKRPPPHYTVGYPSNLCVINEHSTDGRSHFSAHVSQSSLQLWCICTCKISKAGQS